MKFNTYLVGLETQVKFKRFPVPERKPLQHILSMHTDGNVSYNVNKNITILPLIKVRRKYQANSSSEPPQGHAECKEGLPTSGHAIPEMSSQHLKPQ